jgi:hypothetical protein
MLTNHQGSRKKMFVVLKQALVVCGIGAMSILGLTQSSTVAYTQSASESTGQGLVGILPTEPPAGLWDEDFLTLGDSWKEWSEAAAQDVASLYSEEPATLEEQQAALDAIASRLRVLKKALDSPAYSQIHRPLASLHGKLQRRYEFARAILATLQLDPDQARQARLAQAQQEIVEAHERLVVFLQTYGGGTAWLDYLNARDLTSQIANLNASTELVQTVAPIAGKIESRDKLDSEAQQKFLGNRAFLDLYAAIRNYEEIAASAPREVNVEELRGQLATLVSSLESYEDSGSSAAAQAANDAFAEIQKLSADQGDLISAALRAHYYNYNLSIVVSESFLNKILRDRRTDAGQVRDYVMGASVYGNQQTTTEVGVDIRPNNSGLTFDLVLTGSTFSNTAGVTEQATIYTHGNHYFRAAKEVNFDGDRFTTGSARVGVNANNQTVGATTKYDRVPLLGGIAKGVARKEANKRRGESEAIARSKISSQVAPQFDEEVDSRFVTANEELQEKFYAGLRNKDLYPTAMRLRSTNSHLRIDTRTMRAGEFAGNRPNPFPAPRGSAVIDLHESAANNTFDRLGIAGKTLSDEEFAQHLEKFFEEAFGIDLSQRKKEPAVEGEPPYDESAKNTASFIFDEVDPLRVRFEGDQVVLKIRAGLRQEGEEDVPTQEISVPLTFTVQGDKILAESGAARVSPVARPENLQIQIARAGIIRKKISTALPSKELDGIIELASAEGSEATPPVLSIREIGTLNGWLRLVLE